MPTEHRRTTSLDRRHDTPLDPAEMCAMAPTKRLAVAAEDIRHLQRRTHRRGSGRWRHLEAQPVERLGVLRMVLVATCV